MLLCTRYETSFPQSIGCLWTEKNLLKIDFVISSKNKWWRHTDEYYMTNTINIEDDFSALHTALSRALNWKFLYK